MLDRCKLGNWSVSKRMCTDEDAAIVMKDAVKDKRSQI